MSFRSPRRLIAAVIALFILGVIAFGRFGSLPSFANEMKNAMVANVTGAPRPLIRQAARAPRAGASSGYVSTVSATLFSDIETKRWGSRSAQTGSLTTAMFFTLPYHSGNISTVAGSGLGAGLLNARQMQVDLNGDLLVADAGGHRVVRIGNPGSATPTFTVVAGVGAQGFSGDGGQATNATFSGPQGVDIDLNGNVYIADSNNNRVRRVDAVTGIITTIIPPAFGLNNPANIAVDSTGAVYVRDAVKGITKWTPANPNTPTVLDPALAGNAYSLTADKGDPTNTIYFTSADLTTGSGYIFKRGNGGTSANVKIAGNGANCLGNPGPFPCWNGSATPPLTTAMDYSTVLNIQGGYIYFNSQLDNIMGRFKADGTGNLEKIAGNGDNVVGGTGDGGLALNAGIGHYGVFSQGVTAGATPRIYISGNNDGPNNTSRQLLRSFPLGGIINTVPIPSNPQFGGDGGPATDAVVGAGLRRVVFDDTNRMFIADYSNNRIRMVATNGTMSTVAGTGTAGATAVNVSPTSVNLDIKNIAADSAGFIYVATADKKIVKFKPGQNLTLFKDLSAYAGIFDIEIRNDLIYVLMSGNDLNEVLRYTTAGTGLVTMYKNPNILGFAAQSIGVAPDATIYLTNAQGNTLSVGKVTGPNTVTQVAPLTSISQLQANYPLVGNPNGGITYMDNIQAKNYDPNDNSISTVAGVAGTAGFGGDGGPAINSVLSSALGLGYDRNCNLHIADSGNQRVRKVQTLLNATVNSVPAGRNVTVDNVAGTGGLFLDWLSPSQHVISTTSPQAGATGVRYVFVKWSPSNNTGLTENVTASCSNPTYTANFKTQFLLTTVLGANVPAGSATLSPAVPTFFDEAPALSPIVASGIAAGLQFNKWTVTTGIAVVTTPTAATTTIALSSPTTVQANLAAVDGSGTMTLSPTLASAGVAGQTFTFTYTAAFGGMDNGEVDILVPNGWTVPAAGNVNVSTGTKSFVGNTIKVTGVTLNQGQTLTVTFTATPAPGTTTFQTTQKSILGGTLTALASSPSVHAIQAPGATNATTMVNLQTTSGLVITRNAADNAHVTHFKVTNIQNGTLFKNNGTTAINNNDFITVAEGLSGLKFTPALDSSVSGTFAVQASTDAVGTVLTVSTTATITVLKYDTAVVLVSDNNPSGNTQNVTFTATVTANNQPQAPPVGTVPTGSVQFLDGVTPIICSNGSSSTQTIGANGQAECQISTLSVVGSPHAITAVYAGDSSFNGSTSNIVQQVVLPCFSDPVVTSTADSGANTLREAIANICTAPTNNITFNLSYPATIQLASGLTIAKDVNITGPGADNLKILGSQIAASEIRVFEVSSGVTASISGLTMTGGGAVAGINGGGISNAGTLNLSDCAVGDASTTSGNSAVGLGGGIYNTGTMGIERCTISNNVAELGGGGIHNAALAVMTLTNSTVSGNTSQAGSNSGGGINNAGTLTIVNSTIAANMLGGGILNTGTVNIGNTIVADNAGTDQLTGTFNSTGHNMFESTNTAVIGGVTTGNQTADPVLGALTDNGGPTFTHALMATSPAIDQGYNPMALPTDQRGIGFDRTVDNSLIANAGGGDGTDIGAFEFDETVEPETQINSAPPNPSNGASSIFTFSGTDAGGSELAGFECRIVPAAFAACSSGQNFGALSEGSHTFEVRSVDGVGNVDGTPASYTWTVDTTGPDTAITANPTNPSGGSVSFSFSGTDTGGTGVASFECQLDGAGFTACTSPQTYNSLADGSHTFQVRAIDAVGNVDGTPASFTWIVDTLPPDTSITANPTDPSGPNVSFSFTGSDAGSGVASYECDLDGGGFAACTSPKTYTGRAQGSHTFQVRATDNVNNTDPTPASFTWIVDATAPDTTIDTTPPDPSGSGNASFTFSGTDTGGSTVASFECQLDGGGFTACTSPKSYTGLADGSHTFQVRAIDGVGNVDASPAGYTWVVDTTGPDTSITANPTDPSNSSSASFSFTGTDTGGTGVASFECQLDGGGYTACASPKSYTGLADGSHTFQVRALDISGNTDATPASYMWVIDTAPPDTSITANPPITTNSTSASFSFTGTDTGTGVASFECKLDMGAFAACTSAKNYAGLADGSHTFQVRAVDGIGNVDPTPASYTWTVDTDPPDVTINQASGQSDPANGMGITIHFTAVFNEPVTGFTNGDVTIGGTAGATTVVVTQTGPMNGTTYNVAVSGMTTGGTVTVSIGANKANDAAGNGNTASTSTDNTVTYVPNTPPTANPDAYSTTQDTPLTVPAPGVLGNDSDPDAGNTITAVLVSGPTNAASFTLNADGSFNYTPTAGFTGTDTFTYKARDNFNADSNTVTVTLSVKFKFSWVSNSGSGYFGSFTEQGLNQVTAGSDVPLRFTLYGNKGNPYSQAPTSQQINCSTQAPIGAVTVINRYAPDPFYSSLYDFYQTTWRTQTTWKFTCRRLTLHLNDGTTRSLDFYFK